MRARGSFSVGGLHHATRSRVRAYEECPESDSAVCRDVRPDGQERPCQEASDDANWANKGSSKSSGASWAALRRLTGSPQLTCVRFISGLRVISGDAQNEGLTSAFPPRRTSASGQGAVSVPISQFFEPRPGVIRNPVLRIGLGRKTRHFYFRPIGESDDDQPSRSHLYGAWFKPNFGDRFGQWWTPG
jgi:hypothetical protein